jgi:hypothetical protein
MRVSELAKELGYKAAELVELAKAKGIKVEDARANIDARLAAAVRAQVPHRSKLSGALMDVYSRVVTEEAVRAAAKAAEPKPEKPPPKLNADGTEAPKTKRVTRKKEVAPAEAGDAAKPAAAKKEDPKAPLKSPAKKAKVAMEFRLGATDAKAPVKGGEHKHVELTPEEQEEIKKAAATPLIDVDKVIGEAKELHAMRPIEIEVFTRDTQGQESKEKRHVKPVPQAAKPAAPVAPPRPTPRHPRVRRPAAPDAAAPAARLPVPSAAVSPQPWPRPARETPPGHHPDVRAQNRDYCAYHDQELLRTDRHQDLPGHEETHGPGRHDHEPERRAGRGHGRHPGRRVQARRHDHQGEVGRRPDEGRDHRGQGRSEGPGPPRAGRHVHGPRRPRQDVAARQDPQRERREGRVGRHHAAHRRL